MTSFNGKDSMLTFGGHLEVLRQMLLRIIGVTGVLAVVIFCFKETTWHYLLAPSKWNFFTYRGIESIMQKIGVGDFCFDEFHVDLIATELSSQFMTHVSTAVYLGMLGASPYVMFEMFRFISPALYVDEKKYSVLVTIVIYLLFLLGVFMSYFILFPISFRFLGTYSVSESVHNSITIDSYVETFTTLTLVMGIVFQLPVITFFLTKLGFITSSLLSEYRKPAFFLIMFVAAIVTPPDILTLVLVAAPLYLLYEISIKISNIAGR